MAQRVGLPKENPAPSLDESINVRLVRLVGNVVLVSHDFLVDPWAIR